MIRQFEPWHNSTLLREIKDSKEKGISKKELFDIAKRNDRHFTESDFKVLEDMGKIKKLDNNKYIYCNYY